MAASKKRKYTCKVCGETLKYPGEHGRGYHDEPEVEEQEPSVDDFEAMGKLVEEAIDAVKAQMKADLVKRKRVAKLLRKAIAVLES